jgi:hypothetical protein
MARMIESQILKVLKKAGVQGQCIMRERPVQRTKQRMCGQEPEEKLGKSAEE